MGLARTPVLPVLTLPRWVRRIAGNAYLQGAAAALLLMGFGAGLGYVWACMVLDVAVRLGVFG